MDLRTLGNSGTIVSAFALGTMTFGAEADEPTSHAILDRYVAAGGTLIDTADVYSAGTSESIIGRWLSRKHGARDRLVIATKARFPMGPGPNDLGLSRRYLRIALDASLRALGSRLTSVDLQPVCRCHPIGLEDVAAHDAERQGEVFCQRRTARRERAGRLRGNLGLNRGDSLELKALSPLVQRRDRVRAAPVRGSRSHRHTRCHVCRVDLRARHTSDTVSGKHVTSDSARRSRLDQHGDRRSDSARCNGAGETEPLDLGGRRPGDQDRAARAGGPTGDIDHDVASIPVNVLLP